MNMTQREEGETASTLISTILSSASHLNYDTTAHMNASLILDNTTRTSAEPVPPITEVNDRYAQFHVSPSKESLFVMWTVWSTVEFVLAIYITMIFLSILLSSKARRNPFNSYLLFLMVPDIIFTLLCGITCALNASVMRYWDGGWMCKFQSFYCVWGITSNAWLNVVVSYQLHQLLASSHVRRRYTAPSHRVVACHAGIVYLYAAFVGLLGTFDASWWPHQSSAINGLACLPVEFNRVSTFFFYCCYLPIMILIPVFLVLGICYDIWKRKLMPPSGKRRSLAVYFLRIVAVFVVMWLPFCILVCMPMKWPWASWTGGLWAHLQGGVSASLALLKPDIRNAFHNFIRCRGDVVRSSEDNNKLTGFTLSLRFGADSQKGSSVTMTYGQSSQSNEDLDHHNCENGTCDDDDGFIPRQNENYTYEDEVQPAMIPIRQSSRVDGNLIMEDIEESEEHENVGCSIDSDDETKCEADESAEINAAIEHIDGSSSDATERKIRNCEQQHEERIR